MQSRGTGQKCENPPCIIKYRDNFTVYYRFPSLSASINMEVLKTYESKEVTRHKEKRKQII
jgi:hypothetical protein